MADSIALVDLTEMVTLHYKGESPDVPKVGDSDTYDTALLDKDGHEIGTLTGRGKIEYHRPSDNHLMIRYHEELTLQDGTIAIDGWMDGNEIRAGHWQTLDAKGVGGRYAGWTGVRMLRVKEPHRVMDAAVFLFG